MEQHHKNIVNNLVFPREAKSEPTYRDKLVEETYTELRRLARMYLSRERCAYTLQPTSLVHEAYLRLAGQESAAPKNRAHFFAMASQMMRRVLINHALAKKSAKRGGNATHVVLEDEMGGSTLSSEIDVLALDEALTELEHIDKIGASIVELRYFGGLSIEEAALALDISPATVKREWATAKMWLRRRLQDRM